MTAVLLPFDPALLERDDLTVDDLVDLPEDLHYELIEGRLNLTPAGLPIHQILELRIANAIEENCPDDFVVNVEQALLRNGCNELRPDVMVIRVDGARRSPVLPVHVPLVVEVVSKSSRFSDRQEKLKWYAELRIPNYWIVDPLGDLVELSAFALEPDGRYRECERVSELVTLGRPWLVTLDLPAWTRRRDQLR